MDMEKPCRPQRMRRHSRRAWPPEDDVFQTRVPKRLFTPEIKRMLKDWLIRRRDNPYPSRDEKKCLAVETGLTYTQICNWFANWRRKLKNSERQQNKKSWGHLIKNYNTNARGNVEQFSISSEDSIWGEERLGGTDYDEEMDQGDEFASNSTDIDAGCPLDVNHNRDDFYHVQRVQMEHSNYYPGEGAVNTTAECYQISTNTVDADGETRGERNHWTKTKYKQKMMEKYMQEERSARVSPNQSPAMNTDSRKELSKWLESAAKFTPNKHNYAVEWNSRRNPPQETTRSCHLLRSITITPKHSKSVLLHSSPFEIIHHKDELDAAEALTSLAFNCRQRLADSSPGVRQIQALSS